jgi:hypothetical protein
MNEQENITITDLEAPNAGEIMGGETFTVRDETDEDAATRPTTVSAKIRKPGK